jgi:benzoyl-CoA reductase/2-hydroxyglutaryl-CoA dehydratase subunit BcrC/BadD/HgdB
VHFITGREIPMNIDNSNVYKKIKSLLGFNHKRNYNDLCKVYEVFKSIRTESEIWDDLLDSIKNDIESFEH